MARYVVPDVPTTGTNRNKLREAAVQAHKRMNAESIPHTTQAWLKIQHSVPQVYMEETQESFALKVVKHHYSIRHIPAYIPRHSVGGGALRSSPPALPRHGVGPARFASFPPLLHRHVLKEGALPGISDDKIQVESGGCCNVGT